MLSYGSPCVPSIPMVHFLSVHPLQFGLQAPSRWEICFVKDVFLAPNTQHSVIDKAQNSCNRISRSEKGRMGNNTEWSLSHSRNGDHPAWLRKGPISVWQPRSCFLENRCCPLPFKAKSEEDIGKNTFFDGYGNLVAHFLLV